MINRILKMVASVACITLAALSSSIYASRANKPYIENIVIQGIGNLKQFQTLDAISKQVAKNPNYVIYNPTQEAPAGWPSEIMLLKKVELTKQEQQELKTNSTSETVNLWYMNLDGKRWQYFYSYGLDTYLNKLHSYPAFVYERKTENGLTTYKPIIALLVDTKSGRLIQSSNAWCNKVISVANQHPEYIN